MQKVDKGKVAGDGRGRSGVCKTDCGRTPHLGLGRTARMFSKAIPRATEQLPHFLN